MTIEFLQQINNLRPRLIYTTEAYSKILDLMSTVHAKTYEFGFVGLITKENNDYIVESIHLFPQICSAAFFETDDNKYPEWVAKTFKEVKDRKRVRLQGHSHVNMSTTPSGTDKQQILDTLAEVKDFYIQLIINHKQENTCNIYSKEQNLIYSNVPQYLLINKVLLNLKDYTIDNLKELKTNPRINEQRLMFDSGLSIILDGPYYTADDELVIADCKTKQIVSLTKNDYNTDMTKLCTKKVSTPKYEYKYDSSYWDNYYPSENMFYGKVKEPKEEKPKKGRPKKNESGSK